MPTRKETVEFLLGRLGSPERFVVRAMFGEYALYADGKTVALICDDRLYVKIIPTSEDLRSQCEQGSPYPGARAHYVLSEDQWTSLRALPRILVNMAAALPAPKPKKRKGPAK